MKNFTITLLFLIILSLCLSSCAKKRPYSISDSSAYFPTSSAELTSEQSGKLLAHYTPNGNNNDIILNNETALDLYSALDLSKFQEITMGEDFFSDLESKKSIYLWLRIDGEDILEGSRGCFTIYENDIVCYSITIVVSACFYYKAPDGTYKTAQNLIKAAIE
ncbi:MAG: hypothetical protein WCR95_07675 [Eubacteriales bacterium]